jgi:dolichol-phosphate mannosyltransferase
MLLSIVIPLFNEEAVLPLLVARLNEVMAGLDCECEVVFVDDGSRDKTLEMARQIGAEDHRYRVLSFSRNFGHQVAITAGLDFAAGDAVVMMDADLQDPPEVLPKLLDFYRQGFDVVSPQRASRETDTLWKRVTASAFYWIMRHTVDERLTPEVGDFRLLSRAAIVGLRQFREQHRFMRGMIAWLGLKEAIVPFDRASRAAGTTKYPTLKMMAFAWTAVTSFSGLPLALSLWLGVCFSVLGVVYLAFASYSAIVLRATVPGWTSLVFLQVFFSGVMLLSVGLMGGYIAKVYDETKRRPLYVLQEIVNASPTAAQLDRMILLPPRRVDAPAGSTIAPTPGNPRET